MGFLNKIVEKKLLSITEMADAIKMPVPTFHNKASYKQYQAFTDEEIAELKKSVNKICNERIESFQNLQLLTMTRDNVIDVIEGVLQDYEVYIMDNYSEIYLLDIALKNDTSIIASIHIYNDCAVLHSRIDNKKIRSFRFDELELINNYLILMI